MVPRTPNHTTTHPKNLAEEANAAAVEATVAAIGVAVAIAAMISVAMTTAAAAAAVIAHGTKVGSAPSAPSKPKASSAVTVNPVEVTSTEVRKRISHQSKNPRVASKSRSNSMTTAFLAALD